MAMKAYKSYKNVDLPWLKRVPEHWEVARNKNFLSEQKAIVGDNFANYSLLSLTLNGVIIRDVNNGKGKFPASFNTYKIVSPGNMVFCLFDIDETPRTVGLSTHYGMITNAYEVLGVHNITPQYLYYYYLQLDNRKALKPLYHGLRKTITIGTFLQTKLPVPPKEEQDQIVRYLDWQNSRLNKLINAKKKEIALLEEQKQALISQAVTKGLDPHAPLKDSGIDWIGQIPEHWQYSTLGKLTDIILGKMLTPRKKTAQDSLQEYLCARDIHFDNINTENLKQMYFSPSELKQYRVKNGDLLIVEGGAAGTSAIIENIGDRKIMVQNSVHILRSRSKLLNKYVYFWMYSLVRSSYISFCANVTTIPHYTKDKVKSTPIPVPPIKEQQDVIAYLDGVTNTIDETIANIALSISLLQEYRTRLVADVVTGQIDVRNIAIPNYETVPETIDQPETAEESAISAEDQ